MGEKLALAVKLIRSTEFTYHVKHLVSVQNQLLEFTVYCSIFIQDYLPIRVLVGQVFGKMGGGGKKRNGICPG